MISTERYIEIFLLFGTLSLVSFGGVNAVVPEIHRQVVELRHWMSNDQFSELFALSQAAPGPNFLIVSLIGFFRGSLAGAVVATLAICGPSSALGYAVAQVWDRWGRTPQRIAIQRGLAPVTVGLVLASGYVLTRATDHSAAAYVVTGATAGLMLFTRIHPLVPLATGAVLGGLGFI
jgi:chromate transporter